MADDSSNNKKALVAFLSELPEAEPAEICNVLQKYFHDDAVFRIFHPFNEISGLEAATERFWAPLKVSFPDHEHRLGMAIAGNCEDSGWVSTLGHLMGNFSSPWLNIPPTHGLSFLRFGVHARFRGSKISCCYIFLDIVDLMWQAGYYPFRKMPGSAQQWPMPPAKQQYAIADCNTENGDKTLRIVREMQMGLAQGKDLEDLAATRSRHSPHWHKNMNWYGPAGIGSSRGQRGFLDYHGALFIQAFPDRAGIVREPDGPENRPGHFIQLGDGRFAVTAGWPSLYGTHLGGGWLGLPPSGQKVEMRVADWYRIDDLNLIIDNWVMIDILHILSQCGLDVLDDLRYTADPTLLRWPG